MFLIKIIKCADKTAWYYNKIGHIFDVTYYSCDGNKKYYCIDDDNDDVFLIINLNDSIKLNSKSNYLNI